jgi:2-oxoglutarate ferredoxin oxidoreductase subunit gamma
MKKNIENKYDIRLSGTGGQGLILAGIILAEAANLEGKYVVQSQSYGPEARGGASKAEVIISSSPIDFLNVEEADFFLALSPESYIKYCYSVRPKGVIIVDEQVDPKLYLTRVNIFPIIRTAREDLGNEITANMVSLGVLTAISGILDVSTVEEALKMRVPTHTVDLNIKALRKGLELGSERVTLRR